MTINNTKDRIGTIDSQGGFEPKSFSTILQRTELGARINFDVVFNIKLALTDMKDRTSKDIFSLSPDCSHELSRV
jgi:hypothetical protein